MNAIYCRGMYLLLPEEYPAYETFLENLNTRELPATYEMVVLREDHKDTNRTVRKGVSMAPYFLSGYHDEPCTVVIGKREDVYPVQVELLDQASYNTRLRELVEQKCPGCRKFKPLTNRVQSLNGHFEELSLDGVCLFRQETRISPRSFRSHLFSFGGFFKQFHWELLPQEEMLQNLAQWFYLRYAQGILEEAEDRKVLTVACKKKELLSPMVTNAIGTYMRKITTETHLGKAPVDTYAIRLDSPYIFTEETFQSLISMEHQELFRTECKKLGIALAVLEYDPEGELPVNAALKNLLERFCLFPLMHCSGREVYLVAETTQVLKELRYHSPLLEAWHAYISIFGQYDNRRYKIGFPMESKQL